MIRWLKREIVVVIVGAVLISSVPILVVWALTTYTDLNVSKSASIVGSVGTLIAVCLGGVFAIYQFRLFRHNAPHLSVTQFVSHNALSPSYVAIVVTARLKNNSKVRVTIQDTLFRIQDFGELGDEKVEELYAQTFVDQEHNYVQWPTLDEIHRNWSPGGIAVEPNETHTETYEFIVAKRFNSILVYSMFYNPHSSEADYGRRGWQATTVYSIKDK